MSTQKKAVALNYNPEKSSVPKVSAKGIGVLADRLIKIAIEHKVPIKEDPVLVEILTKLDIGENIPDELFKIVAEILAFIYLENGKFEDFINTPSRK
ncbi:MAG: EscU/YscU/HrcU family type III secretion system export apparatus switch protein [Candidatus Schekmanbacteria bacterium]|nr:EscU/YscU/HrcU family type III secretion system export apparatus switch protein [Candidatus Schekmanbacteria bacterium]